MNKRQRVILATGLLLVAVSLLVPPWQRRFMRNHAPGVARTGYRPIFAPSEEWPAYVKLSPEDMAKLSASGKANVEAAFGVLESIELPTPRAIDWELLRMQLIAIGLSTLGALILAGVLGKVTHN